MATRYTRPTMTRARRRAMNRKRLLMGGGALAALLVVALVVLLIPKGGGKDRAVVAPVEASATPEAVVEATLQPTAAPTPTPTAAPASARAQSRPSAESEDFLPVFMRAKTEEKIVAITVDDCYQADNLRQIVDAALAVNGKLTIFPIGENVLREKTGEVLKYAWENGFELENHTFTHNGLFACSGEHLASEVYKQQLALSYVLGVEYQCHFLRPKGGDARHDHRIHAYAKKMGYYGIAHWSAVGETTDAKLAKALQPGAIFLFHTTDTDLEILQRFIPWVAEQGYQLVTLNEMFGYEPNETSEMTIPIEEHTITPLEPYTMVYTPLKATTHCYEAYLVQEKLKELGYLKGDPDGVFGKGCAKAVAAYQQDHGMKATGEADVDLIRTLLGDNEAPAAQPQPAPAPTPEPELEPEGEYEEEEDDGVPPGSSAEDTAEGDDVI